MRGRYGQREQGACGQVAEKAPYRNGHGYRPRSRARIILARRVCRTRLRGTIAHRREDESTMFKIEFEDDKGLWHDVRGPDDAVLTYENEAEARAALAEKYPILVQMEKYAGGKRTRVIRILADDDDWPKS